VLGRKADGPGENVLLEAQGGNVACPLSFAAPLILLMLTQTINVSMLLYRHGEI
jgi:hypothetical protein